MYEWVSNLSRDALGIAAICVILSILFVVYRLALLYLNKRLQAQYPEKSKALTYLVNLYLSACGMVVSIAIIDLQGVQIFKILGNFGLYYAGLIIFAYVVNPQVWMPRFTSPKIVIGLFVVTVGGMLIFAPGVEDKQLRSIMVMIWLEVFVSATIVWRLMHARELAWQNWWATINSAIFLVYLFLHVISYSIGINYFDVAISFCLFSNLFMSSLLIEFTAHLPRNSAISESETPKEEQVSATQVVADLPASEPAKPQNRLVDRYQAWVEQNYHDPVASVELAVKTIGTSYATLNRHLKNRSLPTSKKILIEYRLTQAQQALVEKSPTEVAYSCGFKTPSHFAQAFKAQFGQTPSEFKSSLALAAES